MTNRDAQNLTDEQMNELVIGVNDPTAWGEPIVVGASRGPHRIKHAKGCQCDAVTDN